MITWNSLSSFSSAGSETFSPACDPEGHQLAESRWCPAWEPLAAEGTEPRRAWAESTDVLVSAPPAGQRMAGRPQAAREAPAVPSTLSPTRTVARIINEPRLLHDLSRPAGGRGEDTRGWELGYMAMIAAVEAGDLVAFESLYGQHRASLADWAAREAAWLVRAATRAGRDFSRALLCPLAAETWHLLLAEDGCCGFRNLLAAGDMELVTLLCAATPDGPMRALFNGASRAVGPPIARERAAGFLVAVLARLGLPHPPHASLPCPGAALAFPHEAANARSP